MPDPLQVLILEDSPTDAELEIYELRRAGFEPDWVRVETEAAFVHQLRPDLDLIIADYQLPQFSGVRALACLNEAQLDVPFIMVSGAIGEEMAVELMREGAADYLLKDRLARLGQAVRRAVAQRRDRQIRAEAEHERQRLADNILLQARTFDTLLSAVPDLLILISATRRITYANRAALADWDVAAEDAVGKRIDELNLPPDAAAQLSSAIDSALVCRTASYEGPSLSANGGQRLYEFIVKPVIDSDETIVAIACAGRDITERKAVEAKLRAERELREVFISTLSHDMRTPLATAKLSAELLSRRGCGETVAATLHSRIIENVDRLNGMIETLLDTDLVRAGGTLPLTPEPCSLRSVAQEVIEEMVSQHGDRFQLDGDDAEGRWDCRLIRRILENLLSNAVKHGDPHAPISVVIRSSGGKAALRVHNSGEPIAVEEQALLFEPYRRASSAHSGPVHGWGLGLTMVRAGAEAHGGSVSVQSAAGEGTVFTVLLPQGL